MKTKTDDESKKKLKDIHNKLADKMADDMFRIVKEEVSKVDETPRKIHRRLEEMRAMRKVHRETVQSAS